MKTRICSLAELLEKTMLRFRHDGRELLVVRLPGGYAVFPQKCPHAGGDLSHGLYEGGFVTCRNHGLRFDLADGSVSLDELDEDIRHNLDPDQLAELKLRLCHTVVEDDSLYLID